MQVVYLVIRMVMGIMYPAYNSYKVIQSKDMEEYVNTITYWVVFSLFTAVEQIVDRLLENIFPYFYEFKILFVVWLVASFTKGYSYLFSWLVQPVMMRIEVKVDDILNEVRKKRVNLCNKFQTSNLLCKF